MMSEQKKRTFLVTWKIKKYHTSLSVGKNLMILSHPFKVKAFGGKEFLLYIGLYPESHGDKVMCKLFVPKSCRYLAPVSFTYRVFLLDPNHVVFRSSNIFSLNTLRETDFEPLIKSRDLLREMSFWSEDTLTLQFLMECESDLMVPYPEENSAVACEIVTKLYKKSEFRWSFKISDFQDWTASRVINVSEVLLKVTFRYVNGELKIAFVANFEDHQGCSFACDITLIDDADNEVIRKTKPITLSKKVFEFPYSFFEQDLKRARCFLFKEIKFKLVFYDTFSFSLVNYYRKDSEAVKDTSLASTSSQQDQSIRHFNGSEAACLSYLQQDLRNLLEDKKFTDIKLRADDQLFSAHKSLLSARSPVFSAMFDQDMLERQSGIVDIIDVDAKTLKLFLDYVYTCSVDDMNEEIALNLLVVADKYQVVPLIQKCSTYLKSVLSLKNACEVLMTADMVNNDDLISSSIEYIVENSTKILTSPEWLQLLKTNNTLATDVLAKVSKKFDDRTKQRSLARKEFTL